MKRFVSLLTIALAAFAAISCNDTQDDFLDGITPFSALSIEQFNALGVTKEYYAISGTIKSVVDNHYSEFVIEDNTGSVSVYGLWDCEGGDRIMDMGSYAVGDKIAIAAKGNTFKGAPEAKNSFPYDPSNIAIWAAEIEREATADGGEISIEVHARNKVDVEVPVSWMSAEYSATGNRLKISVNANNSNSSRSAKVKLVCNNQTVKVNVKQVAAVAPKVSIADAVTKGFATIEGVVSILMDDGVILSDATGSILVTSDDFSGIDQGSKLEVTGSITTENYITVMNATEITSLGTASSELSSPKECDMAELLKMQSELSSAGSDKPNQYSMKYVMIDGVLNENEGVYYIEDYDKGNIMVNLKNTDGFNIETYSLVLVTVKGFIAEYADGVVAIVPASIEKKAVQSAVKIDGSFADWASISGYVQDNTNNIYELKLYTVGTDIYMYAKMRADAFTEFDTMKYFIQIYFNTDNDNSTGPAAWVFKGLECSGYVRMTNGVDGFWIGKNGDGSTFYDFIYNNPDATFISANKTKFDGDFTAINSSYPCGGIISGEVAEFEWVYSMADLHLPRHTSVGVGVRLVHEGSDNPYRAQANYLIPTDGWWSYTIQ